MTPDLDFDLDRVAEIAGRMRENGIQTLRVGAVEITLADETPAPPPPPPAEGEGGSKATPTRAAPVPTIRRRPREAA